jgi:hypothetical protein
MELAWGILSGRELGGASPLGYAQEHIVSRGNTCLSRLAVERRSIGKQVDGETARHSGREIVLFLISSQENRSFLDSHDGVDLCPIL